MVSLVRHTIHVEVLFKEPSDTPVDTAHLERAIESAIHEQFSIIVGDVDAEVVLNTEEVVEDD